MYTFKPSVIAEKIYEMLDEYMVSTTESKAAVVPLIEEMFDKKYPYIKYTTEQVGDYMRGTYAISWVEKEEPVLVMFNYVNE